MQFTRYFLLNCLSKCFHGGPLHTHTHTHTTTPFENSTKNLILYNLHHYVSTLSTVGLQHYALHANTKEHTDDVTTLHA